MIGLRGYLYAGALAALVASHGLTYWYGARTGRAAAEAAQARAVAALEARLARAAEALSRKEAERLEALREAEEAGRAFEDAIRADPAAGDVSLPAGIVRQIDRQ